MAGKYEFWLTDDRGRRLADSQGRTLLDNILGGTFQRVANNVARFSARFPASFDTTLIRPDRMVQVWRAPEGERLSLFRVYFVRWWRYARIGSDLLIEMSGPDCNDLLRRRIVANYAQTVGSEKRDYADDMMKEVVDEQLVSDTSDPAASYGSRVMPGFTVEADTSQGPILSKAFAWQKVSQVVSDLQRATWAEDNEVFWDVAVSDVSSTGIAFQFRTKTGQPGADLTDRIVFDEARGNLEAAELTYDWTQEENYIYSLGQGEDQFRDVVQAYDTIRIALSQYARSEDYAYSSFSSSPEAVEARAKEALLDNRPRRVFSGQAIDTVGTRFGRDWNYGDRVTARFLRQEFEAIIRQVIITLDSGGREIIDARIESIGWDF